MNNHIIYLDIDNNLYIDDYNQPKITDIKLVVSSGPCYICVDHRSIIYYGYGSENDYKIIRCSESVLNIYNYHHYFYYETQTGIYHFTSRENIIKIAEYGSYLFPIPFLIRRGSNTKSAKNNINIH